MVVLACALAIAGCSKEHVVGETVPGSDPGTPATGNRAPSINGTPPSTAKVNVQYDFTPSAFDPDGDSVRFTVTSKPAWASFNANTGRLYGTPPTGTTGTFGGIEIRVTDGVASAALPVFSIVVLTATPSTGGPAVLSWSRPTQNTDGSSLTNLAGYRLYYGQSASQLNAVREITSAATTSITIDGLATGTWYFSLASFTTSGTESTRVGPVSVTIT